MPTTVLISDICIPSFGASQQQLSLVEISFSETAEMASSEQTTDFQDILTAVISKNTHKLTELLQHERCKHILNNWDDQVS